MIHLTPHLGISYTRVGLLLLFCGLVSSATAQQPSASEKLREAFFAALKQQITEFVEESPGRNAQMSPAETSQVVQSLMKEAQIAYGPLFTLPEAEANQLLTTGPDDKANMAAMQKDIGVWKTVQLPMPALYKFMQEKVMIGKIQGGLELELSRRISEFHLKQLGKLSA